MLCILSLPSLASHLSMHRDLIKSFRARMDGAEYVGDTGVVLQPHRNDCGAACLKMVLAAHGIESDLARLAAAARTRADGASLLALREAAAREGLSGRAWMLTAADLAKAPFPVLLFIRGDHFVVVRRFVGSDVLEIDDPAIGRLRWPMASFRRVWKGESLVFDPAWDPATDIKIVPSAHGAMPQTTFEGESTQ
ncbi:MAG TPA: cysteine peptidase family C39 domain-containing protein [Thermoanaerobaculia bacterium]|nr:cysteine peptidase family C39 domain-containing protein [Thermoanaerobaculia bacterium]